MTNRIEVTGTLPDVTLTFRDGTLKVTQWPTVTPQPGRPLWESYGICTHHFGKGVYADVDGWTQKVADLGAYAFRSGAFAKLDQVKRAVVRARELGLKFLGIVANEQSTEAELRANLDFVAANPDVFVAVEGINEPASADIAKVVRFQKLIWDYVQTNDVPVAVLSPALRMNVKPEFYQQFVNAGILGTFDVVSLHHYNAGTAPSVEGLRAHIDMVQEQWACSRIWVTETGYTNATESSDPRRATEEASAAYAVRNVLEFLDDPRVEKVFRYELLNDLAPVTNNEAHFGLWRADDTRKPEVGKVAEFLASLNGGDTTPVELEVTAPDGVRQLLVGRTLWLWRPGTLYDTDPMPVTVATPSGVQTADVGGAAVGVPLETG